MLFVGIFYAYKIMYISKININQSMLDGCYHVYLDVGSNIGIQVRKLFEPERYPKAKILSIYDEVFGNIDHRKKENHKNGKRICAVGFEPNPQHTKYLKNVEESYNSCGYRVKFYTDTAVSRYNGKATFYSDENFKRFEWGGGLLSPDFSKISKRPKNKTAISITTIKLSDFLRDTVAKRKLPITADQNDPPKVLMKMDIEGSEIDVIPDIIFNGGLQYLYRIMIEWHSRIEKKDWRKKTYDSLKKVTDGLSKYSELMHNETGHFDFKLMRLDDETYATITYPLPQCQSSHSQ